VKNTIFEMRV